LTFRVNQSLPKRRPASIIPTLGRLVSPRLTRRSHPDCRAIDHLEFRVSALGQGASGSIDVAEDHVRLEILLPWLLAQLGEKIRPLIRNQGTLLLDKK
jgi:hypothetical protein